MQEDMKIILDAIGGMESRLEKKIDETNQRIDATNQRLDGVNEEILGINQRLDATNEEIVGINQRLDGVNEEILGINQRLDATNERIDATESRLMVYMENTIGAKIDALFDGYKGALEKQVVLEITNKAMAEKLAEIDERVKVLEDRAVS